MEEFDMKKSIEYYDWTNGNEEISKKQFNKRLKKLKGKADIIEEGDEDFD